MTGFGASTVKAKNVEVEIQIRSVNARFLDLRFHLPKEYLAFESDLKKRAAKVMQRGCIDVFVHRRPNVEARLIPIRFNKVQAKAWKSSIEHLRKTLNMKDEVQLRDVLSLPHIFEMSDRVVLNAQEISSLKKAFEVALKACLKARSREGEFLRKEILRLLDELQKTVQLLLPWREKAQDRVEKRLHDRLKEAKVDPSDTARLAMETALQLDKMDIREELMRLGEHIKACQNWARSSEIHGKKLDFYAQELLREANTIGSKIQNAEMTELVVRAKTIIENFREQVQNVE